MWELIVWPPRTPRTAWLFVTAVFFVCLLGLGLAFYLPSKPAVDEEKSQEILAYHSGYGVALSVIETLARSGDRVAQLELGERYMAGVGVAKDVGQGLRWMKASSDNGYARAHRRFAMFYDDIVGSGADIQVSCKYHLRAAFVGEAESQYLVGIRARDGVGFVRDPVEAYAWLSLASASHLAAYRARIEMEQGSEHKLTADELERARVRSLLLRKEISGASKKDS
jgi:hypothetical protein